MLHAGIGPSHVNALLTSINIPPVSQSTFKAREREVGPAIEEVAKALCKEAMEVEKEFWRNETEEVVSIGASYDMGWKKRGKGHNGLPGQIEVLKPEIAVVYICNLFSGANHPKGCL